MQGVTVEEFGLLCERHPFYASVVPRRSLLPFLERCCELGLLTMVVDVQGTIRFVPTPELMWICPTYGHH